MTREVILLLIVSLSGRIKLLQSRVAALEEQLKTAEEVTMKCYKCNKDLDKDTFVYSVKGLGGYYCILCAMKLKKILGMGYEKVSNLPYYTD